MNECRIVAAGLRYCPHLLGGEPGLGPAPDEAALRRYQVAA